MPPPPPQIIELSGGGVPWKEHLYQLEQEQGIEGLLKFCIYEVGMCIFPVVRVRPWRFRGPLASRRNACCGGAGDLDVA